MRLLLESTLALDCQFGRHDCGVEQSVGLARNCGGVRDGCWGEVACAFRLINEKCERQAKI